MTVYRKIYLCLILILCAVCGMLWWILPYYIPSLAFAVLTFAALCMYT